MEEAEQKRESWQWLIREIGMLATGKYAFIISPDIAPLIKLL